jgi:hypothetical protein
LGGSRPVYLSRRRQLPETSSDDIRWGPFLHVGPEDALTGHPYYKVGGPDGCMMNCEIKIVYYSTYTPPTEIQRLTSYDFSCFTRFNPCTEMEDLLPAAREWNIHKEELQTALPEKLCDVSCVGSSTGRPLCSGH